MDRAKEKNVKFNREKVQYKQKEIKFLGHIISGEGISLNPSRTQAIQALNPPKNKKELQTMLGFINYVRNYIPNLSDISTPIRELLKKSVVFQWLDQHDQCLKKIKNLITNAPILKAFNCNESITIQTDASKDGLGCCLLQNKRPVSFASCSLTDAEKNYAQIEKEMLAIVFACSKWHNLIYGREIEIVTDHKPLLGIMSKEYQKISSSKLKRMKLRLEKYNLKLTYLPGKYMYIADFLSRNFNTKNINKHGIEGLSESIHTINVSDEKKKMFQNETENDIVLQKIKQFIKNGWPKEKKICQMT